MSKALFILKRREDYNSDPSYGNSPQIATGMWNSAMFCALELQAKGHTADVVMVHDANGIDSVVTGYDPDFVFIEGLWVTPAKFTELLAIPRHQQREWVVRVHSEIPFLATEGVAMNWIAQYLLQGLTVAPNAPRAHEQLVYYARKVGLDALSIEQQVVLLPNCYPTNFDALSGLDTSSKTTFDVACFGAFRPMKNQLQQLFIASKFADYISKPLRFHTNSRFDSGGIGPGRNVDDACQAMGVEHVQHAWEDRSTFLQSLRDCDILLQLSMSETFNIVAADATFVGRPMLVSDEISWAYPLYGNPQNVDDCLKKLEFIWANKQFFINKSRSRLSSFAKQSARTWDDFVT